MWNDVSKRNEMKGTKGQSPLSILLLLLCFNFLNQNSLFSPLHGPCDVTIYNCWAKLDWNEVEGMKSCLEKFRGFQSSFPFHLWRVKVPKVITEWERCRTSNTDIFLSVFGHCLGLLYFALHERWGLRNFFPCPWLMISSMLE